MRPLMLVHCAGLILLAVACSSDSSDHFAVTPDSSWETHQVRLQESEPPLFTVQTPPGWSTNARAGFDSIAGDLIGNDFALTFEIGGVGAIELPIVPGDPDYEVIIRQVEGVPVEIATAKQPAEESNAVTAALYEVLPGRDIGSDKGDKVMNVIGEGLSEAQQQAAIAIFLSVRDGGA